MAYSKSASEGYPLAPLPAPQQGNSFLSALLAAQGMTVRDKYYKGQTIHLDGYTFVNCCFHNCTLVTETGVFTIDACTISSCSLRFGFNGIRMIRLFNLLDGFSSTSLFNPDIAHDGAVTIK